MEPMTITLVKVIGATALVRAVSHHRVAGQPEAVITVRVRLPAGATQSAARDIALKYLDPA